MEIGAEAALFPEEEYISGISVLNLGCWQVLLRQSFQGAVGVYVAAALLATASCCLLPIETRGREMKDRSPS